jgi:hypothetical protein
MDYTRNGSDFDRLKKLTIKLKLLPLICPTFCILRTD